MATVEFMDGGELGHTGLWDWQSTSPSTGAEAAGFTGTYYFPTGSSPKKLLTDRTSYYFGMRYKSTDVAGDQVMIIYGNDGGTALGRLIGYNDTAGNINILHWHNYVSYTATSMVLLNSTVYRIEMYLLRNTYSGATPNSDGAITIKINGVIVLQQTNIRSVSSNYDIDGVEPNANSAFSWDDFIVVQDAWPGNIRIQKCIPEGSGTNTQWDASAGSNFDCVNEIPYDDEDFISTNTNDEIDTYQTSDLVEGSNPIDSILAVQLSARAKLEGSPTPQDIQLAIKSSSSYGYSGNKQVQEDTFSWHNYIYNTDPATSAAWAKAAVNAMEIGVKAKART